MGAITIYVISGIVIFALFALLFIVLAAELFDK